MDTKKIVIKGLLIALVVVSTSIIHIPVPFTEGYIHGGDSIIFISGILFGWQFGLVAGGLGSALADTILGYTHWALPTLIIKGIMGAMIGFISNDFNKEKYFKYKNYIIVFMTFLWIGIVYILRSYLNKILMGINSLDISKNYIHSLGFDSIDSFISSAQKVNTYLAISMIILPFVILLFYVIIKKREGYINILNNIIGMCISGIWMVIGYYIAGGILKGNMIIPIFSIPANIIQFIGGGLIAYFLLMTLKRINGIDKYIT